MTEIAGTTGVTRITATVGRMSTVLAFLVAIGPVFSGDHAGYTFGILGGKRQMAQSERHIYYINDQKELCVFEKPARDNDMTTPDVAGKLELKGVPEALEWIDQSTLCVSTGHHLAFVDVAKPTAPRLERELEVAEAEMYGVSEMKLIGSSLYLAARRQGLVRVDLSDATRPRIDGVLPLPGFAMSLDTAGELMVVATGVGLSFVRLDGRQMALESSLDTFRRAEVVRTRAQHLVFASKEYLCIYDITRVGRPRKLSEISNRDPFFYSHNVAVQLGASRIYVAATEGGLYVHDWADPSAPRLAAQFSIWGNEKRLKWESKAKYLEALGVSGTSEELARLVPGKENAYIIAVGMAIDGERAYLVDYVGKLWGLKMSPGKPSLQCFMWP